MRNSKQKLEERLVDFAVLVLDLVDCVENTKKGNHLSGQIIRSGTSPALNYGEAQAAESRNDFVHKMKLALKELRETFVNLKIIKRAKLCNNDEKMEKVIKENNELIAIFVASLKTATNRN